MSEVKRKNNLVKTSSNDGRRIGKNFSTGGLAVVSTGLLFAFGIRTCIVETRYVPSASMEPTIKVNDRVLVDKLSYKVSAPQRNDIVVFNPTFKLLKLNIYDALIKRVIGLPGEKVQVKHGRVFINNQPLQENYVAVKPTYDWGPQVVPSNSFLVLGDNRNHSYDGHNWGFLPRKQIIGQAVYRYWPLNRTGMLLKKRDRID